MKLWTRNNLLHCLIKISILFCFFLVYSLCTLDNGPGTFQSCIMPRDCETSDWSAWSPCSKTCRASDMSPGFRVRSRSITQNPIGHGKECPTLEEKEACNIIGDLLPNCPRFVTFTFRHFYPTCIQSTDFITMDVLGIEPMTFALIMYWHTKWAARTMCRFVMAISAWHPNDSHNNSTFCLKKY